LLLRAAVRRCGVGDWKSATGGERERSVPRSPIRAKGSSIAAAAKDRKRGKMNDATRARGGRRTACGCAPRCTWRRSGAGTATPPSPSSSCPSTRRTACHGAPARASSLRLARRAMANAISTAGRRARRRDDRDVCVSGRGSGLKRDGLEISKQTSIGRDGTIRFQTECFVRDEHTRTLLAANVLVTRVSSSARAARASRPRAG
jgi:hypothetical protein